MNRFTALVILSLAIMSSTAFLRTNQDDTIPNIRRRYWVLKTHRENKYDFLIYGDSRIYRGLAPQAFKKDFNSQHILNFGYSSASFSSFMLDEVDKRIDLQSKNKVLLLGITPNSLSYGASADRHYKEELNRKREEVLEVLYLKPLRDKLAPFQITTQQGEAKARYEYHEEYHDDGWVASWQTPPDTTRANTTYINNFKTNRISPGMVDTLLLRVAAWRKKNIRVIALRPPTTQTMVNIEKASGFDELDFIKRFRAAGGEWITLPMRDYDTYDGSHMTKLSALKYSGMVSSKIKKKKGG